MKIVNNNASIVIPRAKQLVNYKRISKNTRGINNQRKNITLWE
jgi:hypothetical protein